MKYEIAPKSVEVKLNWTDARFYCFSLNIDGKTGWRLPSKKELDTFDMDTHQLENGYYWSGQSNSDISSWVQKFNGYRHQCAGHVLCLNWVRPVRDLKRKRTKR